MKIYLVGGAVRDQLLKLPVTEKDWVVVGARPQELIDLGYRPVGKEFPVFLHPETHEEYALARTERKTAPGYKGFVFHADKGVSLEEDLSRRDLSINAMAMDEQGTLIDPYGGQQDLQQRIFRHVSPAFSEDPVRILRVARFAARFHHLGFKLADDTLTLMIAMVKAGETQHLVAERVWQECSKALQERSPEEFFLMLERCQAMDDIFPELSACLHKSVANLSKITEQPLAVNRFAALCYALDEETVALFCQRLAVPNHCGDLARLVKQHCECIVNYREQSSQAIINALRKADIIRKPERFCQLLDICFALDDSATIAEEGHTFWLQAQSAYQHVDTRQLIEQGYKDAALGAAIMDQRIKNIEELLAATHYD